MCNHSLHGDSLRQFGFTPHPLLKNKGIQAVVNVVNTLAWINFSLAENTSLCLGLLTERYCGVSDPSALQKKQCCKFVTWRAIEKTLSYFIKRFKTDIICYLELSSGNISSQILLTNMLPNDWKRLITDGSQTLTLSVRDLTWNKMHVFRLLIYQNKYNYPKLAIQKCYSAIRNPIYRIWKKKSLFWQQVYILNLLAI